MGESSIPNAELAGFDVGQYGMAYPEVYPSPNYKSNIEFSYDLIDPSFGPGGPGIIYTAAAYPPQKSSLIIPQTSTAGPPMMGQTNSFAPLTPNFRSSRNGMEGIMGYQNSFQTATPSCLVPPRPRPSMRRGVTSSPHSFKNFDKAADNNPNSFRNYNGREGTQQTPTLKIVLRSPPYDRNVDRSLTWLPVTVGDVFTVLKVVGNAANVVATKLVGWEPTPRRGWVPNGCFEILGANEVCECATLNLQNVCNCIQEGSNKATWMKGELTRLPATLEAAQGLAAVLVWGNFSPT